MVKKELPDAALPSPGFFFLPDGAREPAKKKLGVMVFFEKAPTAALRDKIAATVPPPLRSGLTWVGSALWVSTADRADRDVRLGYDEALAAFAFAKGIDLAESDAPTRVRAAMSSSDNFDIDDASPATYTLFFSDVARWLHEVTATHPILFVHTSGQFDWPDYAAVAMRSVHALPEVVLPHLTRLFESTKKMERAGVGLLDKISFDIAKTALVRAEELGKACTESLVALTLAVLEADAGCDVAMWRANILDVVDPNHAARTAKEVAARKSEKPAKSTSRRPGGSKKKKK